MTYVQPKPCPAGNIQLVCLNNQNLSTPISNCPSSYSRRRQISTSPYFISQSHSINETQKLGRNFTALHNSVRSSASNPLIQSNDIGLYPHQDLLNDPSHCKPISQSEPCNYSSATQARLSSHPQTFIICPSTGSYTNWSAVSAYRESTPLSNQSFNQNYSTSYIPVCPSPSLFPCTSEHQTAPSYLLKPTQSDGSYCVTACNTIFTNYNCSPNYYLTMFQNNQDSCISSELNIAYSNSTEFPAVVTGLDTVGVSANTTSQSILNPYTSTVSCDGVTKPSFIQSSVADIDLTNLEELLARTSVNDVYLGPVKSADGKLLSLDPSVQTINNCLTLPYSSSSLAFSPPGITIVTEIWSTFLQDRISHCNSRIHSMSTEALRSCLYAHGLNQLGCPAVLRRRLQEFVRRTREAQCIDYSGRFSADSQLLKCDEVLGELQLNSQYEGTEQLNLFSGFSESGEQVANQINSIKLDKPVILTPDTFYSYLLIIDLEATCDLQEGNSNLTEYPHEIIEFPVLLYDTRSRRCISVFHAYCKPKLHPDLSTFCTNLTKISQNQVDNAQPFPMVLKHVENWLFKKHNATNLRYAIVCDCSSDMGKFMRIQCRLNDIPIPSWASVWINLSKAYRAFYKLPARHRVTLITMLKDLNLSFVGQRHRGLDDAINILRIVRIILADGCQLRVNERIDFGRPPNYVASISRAVAEATSGIMGSKVSLLSRKPKSNNYGNSNGDGSSGISEDHRESLLWLADVRKQRLHKD